MDNKEMLAKIKGAEAMVARSMRVLLIVGGGGIIVASSLIHPVLGLLVTSTVLISLFVFLATCATKLEKKRKRIEAEIQNDAPPANG